MRTNIIVIATYYMATAVSDYGLPTYKLIFDAGTELHGADGPFLWGVPVPTTNSTTNNNQTIANIMKDWYLGFVLNLDPNSIDNSGTPKPQWPQYQAEGQMGLTVMDVNYTMIGQTSDPDASARCDFFHGQSYVVRN